MLWQKGRVIVTGGAGLIGSAVIWALNKRGITDVIAADHLGEDEKWRNLRALRFCDYVDGDTLHKKLLENPSAFGKISCILHLGACSATTETDAGYLMRNNYGVTRDLAHWALENSVRFVYASSAATYGDGEFGMEDGDAPIDRLRPLNKYGWSKQLFDQHARRLCIDQKIVGIKYFNVFGPNENHKGSMRSVVHKATQQIQETSRVSLFKSYHKDYANGEQMRDFLYVKDAAEMTLHLAEFTQTGGLYNLGSGQANTWKSLVSPIFEALNLPVQIDFIDMPEELKGKYQYYTCANIERLQKSGYRKPITALDVAVKDYVREYLVPDLHLGEPEQES